MSNILARYKPLLVEAETTIVFAERFVRHPRGPLAGEPFLLVDEHKEILRKILATDPETGLWKHRTVVISLARKSAKTALLSIIALRTLLAQVPGIEVYCAANSRKQAAILKDNVDAYARMSNPIARRLNVYKHRLENRRTSSFLETVSAEASTAHGTSPVLGIVDEGWAFSNMTLPDALASGMGARPEGMLVHISTPAVEGSAFAALCDYGERVNSGEISDPTFGYYAIGCDQDDPHDDPETWAKGSLGVRHGWISEKFMESQLNMLSESEFRRLLLGQRVSSRESWLPTGAWANCLDRSRTVVEGEPIFIGVDGSWSGDSTAAVAVTLDGRVKVLGLWERPPGDAGRHWRADPSDLDACIRAAVETYRVQEIACDPFFVSVLMAEWAADGLPVVEWKSNQLTLSIPATQKLYAAISDGQLSHDGDRALTRHIGNSAVKIDSRGARITKSTPSKKIDAAVALMIAHDRMKSVGSEKELFIF